LVLYTFRVALDQRVNAESGYWHTASIDEDLLPN
jgi:hypothetical protein